MSSTPKPPTPSKQPTPEAFGTKQPPPSLATTEQPRRLHPVVMNAIRLLSMRVRVPTPKDDDTLKEWRLRLIDEIDRLIDFPTTGDVAAYTGGRKK